MPRRRGPRISSADPVCATPGALPRPRLPRKPLPKRILPGRTTATQWSGAPLPLPIRVSAGFLVTGLSGNKRIQILPPRFTKRVMATRLASICRSVIQPGSMTFRPKSPNASEPPRHALPHMRPRCCLRYFTFFGINIISSQFPVLSCQLPATSYLLQLATSYRLLATILKTLRRSAARASSRARSRLCKPSTSRR